jgi:DNA-binding GntR family transcriptional regulator
VAARARRGRAAAGAREAAVDSADRLRSGEALLAYFGLSGDEDLRAGSYTEAAVRIIRDRILDLTLAPGSRIDDRLMMERFRMGRTPAREAFNRLSAEGLIVIQRNRGAFVRPIDLAHVQQFFDAYIASERLVGYFCQLDDAALAGELAHIQREYLHAYARRAFGDMTRTNARLHGRIAIATRNEYVAENAFRLYNHARRLSYFVSVMEKDFFEGLHETQEMIRADHDRIIDVVRRRDNAKLVDILTRHAGMFHDRVMRVAASTRGAAAPLPVPPAAADAARAPRRRRAPRRGSG